MQIDAEVLTSDTHNAVHAIEAARAIDADVIRLEKRIAETKAYLAELRATREKRLAEMRQVLRGEPAEQPELPFPAETVDGETGEITLTTEAAAAADRITGDGFEARLTRVGGGEIVPLFTLDGCRFNRKETRRAFEALTEERGLAAVADAIEQAADATATLTMADFHAVEEAVCRPADEEE